MNVKILIAFFAIVAAARFSEADEPTTELGKKQHLHDILEKIKDAIEEGKSVREDLVVKSKEIIGKLKDLNVDLGSKARELIQQIEEKGKEILKPAILKIF